MVDDLPTSLQVNFGKHLLKILADILLSYASIIRPALFFVFNLRQPRDFVVFYQLFVLLVADGKEVTVDTDQNQSEIYQNIVELTRPSNKNPNDVE